MEILKEILTILFLIIMIVLWFFITISMIKDIKRQKELNEKMKKSLDLQIEQINKEIEKQEQLAIEIKKDNKKVGRPKKEGK